MNILYNIIILIIGLSTANIVKCHKTYKVRKNDYCYKISADINISLENFIY